MDFSKCGRGFKKCGTMNYVCVAVYLQASPETCQSRIKKRNRHEEQDVPIVSGPLGFKIRLSVCKTTSTTRSKAIIMYCPVVPTIARDEKSQGWFCVPTLMGGGHIDLSIYLQSPVCVSRRSKCWSLKTIYAYFSVCERVHMSMLMPLNSRTNVAQEGLIVNNMLSKFAFFRHYKLYMFVQILYKIMKKH